MIKEVKPVTRLNIFQINRNQGLNQNLVYESGSAFSYLVTRLARCSLCWVAGFNHAIYNAFQNSFSKHIYWRF